MLPNAHSPTKPTVALPSSQNGRAIVTDGDAMVGSTSSPAPLDRRIGKSMGQQHETLRALFAFDSLLWRAAIFAWFVKVVFFN